MSDIFARLAAPFPPEKVSWRVGATNGDKTKGMALAYIDARDVMERLDEVVGPGCWQNDYPHANGKTVCRIGIWMPGFRGGYVSPDNSIFDGWVWKSDGAGDTDHEAEKGALSDAFKRAAVRWGIGRYLYDLDSPWVKIEQRGRSYVIAQEEYSRLRAALGGKPPKVERPAPKPTPTSSKLYLDLVASIIKEATDYKDLGEWWNSDEQKQQRADILEPEDVDALKAECIAKIETLKAQHQAKLVRTP